MHTQRERERESCLNSDSHTLFIHRRVELWDAPSIHCLQPSGADFTQYTHSHTHTAPRTALSATTLIIQTLSGVPVAVCTGSTFTPPSLWLRYLRLGAWQICGCTGDTIRLPYLWLRWRAFPNRDDRAGPPDWKIGKVRVFVLLHTGSGDCVQLVCWVNKWSVWLVGKSSTPVWKKRGCGSQLDVSDRRLLDIWWVDQWIYSVCKQDVPWLCTGRLVRHILSRSPSWMQSVYCNWFIFVGFCWFVYEKWLGGRGETHPLCQTGVGFGGVLLCYMYKCHCEVVLFALEPNRIVSGQTLFLLLKTNWPGR